jgi:hypothetical protein
MMVYKVREVEEQKMESYAVSKSIEKFIEGDNKAYLEEKRE